MPVNEADQLRLLELPPKLMLLADTLDVTWPSTNDKWQQDLRWLSEQLPKLLEELAAWLTIGAAFDDCAKELAEAQAGVKRLTGIICEIGNYHPEGCTCEFCHQALSPEEAKDARDCSGGT